MKRIVFLTTLFSLTSFFCAYAQTVDKAKLDQLFDRLSEKNKAMGSLLIAKDGNAVYTRAIGFSHIDGTEKKPLTMANRFRIGSITKMFTAVMTLQLVEEGKLKLTDHLDKFLPQVPNASKITIVQILGHRSGIPNVTRNQEGANTIPITRDEMLKLIVAGKPGFEPDTKTSYSNSGYQILGFIIEKVTGKSYAEELGKRIISRIGLKDTYLGTGTIDVNKNEALTYMNLGGEWKQMPETHPSILYSAGAIISTPNDLAKFIQALFDGKLVSKEHLTQMKTIREGDGLGMESYTYNDRIFYGHAGGADNYGSWLAYMPEERLAVVYTTNAKVHPVRDIVSGVVDIYYNKPFQVPTFESFAVSPEVLDKYVGIYSTADAPVKFTISRQGTTLSIQPNGETPAPLEATAENKFRIQGAINIVFDADKKQMTIIRGGRERVFTKEN